MYGSGRRSAKALLTPFPVQRGFLYLVAIMDWATRHVIAWRLSNTMDAGFCVEALNDALARYGWPEIFNTDQGTRRAGYDFDAVIWACYTIEPMKSLS